MIRQVNTGVLLATFLFLGACASPKMIQSVRPEDAGLACDQLQTEFMEAERLRSDAAKEKAGTQGKVVQTVRFWPPFQAVAENASELMAAAEARKVHLAKQMALKNCAATISGQSANANGTAGATQTPVQASDATSPKPSKEEKLEELRRLYYANHISPGAYTEMKKAIMDAP